MGSEMCIRDSCTTPDGDVVQYVLSHVLPEWSREHIASLARGGEACATRQPLMSVVMGKGLR